MGLLLAQVGVGFDSERLLVVIGVLLLIALLCLLLIGSVVGLIAWLVITLITRRR